MSDVIVPKSKLDYLTRCHELVKTRLELELLDPASQERIVGIMKWHIALQAFADDFVKMDSDAKQVNPDRGEDWFGSYKHGPDLELASGAADENQLFGIRVLEVTESIQVMLGSDVNAMNLAEWVNHIHPSDIDHVVKTQLEHSVAILPFEVEYRYFNTDLDAWRVLRCSSYPELKTTKEESYYQGVMLDVTDIRRAQQGLIEPIEDPFPRNEG